VLQPRLDECGLPLALQAFGHDEASLLGVNRQLGDSLRRLAESQVRLFHTRVDERLAAEGHPAHSWTDDLNQVAASMLASLERSVGCCTVATSSTGYTTLTKSSPTGTAAGS
jgi:hypothetical protein